MHPMVPPSRYLFLLLFVSGLMAGGHANAQPVMDLRGADLKQESVSLSGPWDFYWRRLYYPGQTADQAAIRVDLPGCWTSLRQPGSDKSYPAFGYATYRLKVLLPRIGPLALAMPETYTAYRLYVNGGLFLENGKVDTSATGFSPHWFNLIRQLPEDRDTLDLVLQIANFAHSKGGIREQIRLGLQEEMLIDKARGDAGDFIISGFLLVGGLFFFSLYLFGSRDKATLYFALFCLAYSYRITGAGEYQLHNILPALSWYLTVRLEYLSLYLSVIFLALYIRNLYPEETNGIILATIKWICWLLVVFAIVTEPAVFTRLMQPFLLVIFLYIAYAYYVYIRAVGKKRAGSVYALLSIAVLMLLFIVVNLQYFGFLQVPEIVIVFGYFSFFFLQSLVLSFRFSFDLKESRRIAERALSTKSEFLSTMSHEIRTPLNSVIGMSHLLLEGNPRADQKENLEVLMFSAGNLLGIVNDILDYNKMEAGQIDMEQIPMNLVVLIKNVVASQKPMADRQGIELRLNYDHGLDVPVLGDPFRLGQVLNNLVNNAIKFTREGWVEVAAQLYAKNPNALEARIIVADTGIGIPPEKQKMIFERFTQADSSTSRSFGGTGLGLAISKRIVELMRSRLELKSEPGRGAEFSFIVRLPVAETPTQPGSGKATPATVPEAVADNNNMPLENRDVLLVEDNPVNVLVAKSFLQKWGARVDVAENGRLALDQVDPSRHAIVLMDLHMPEMDGYESTAKMRERGIRLPIIALTASVMDDTRGNMDKAGIDDVINKPFNPKDLLETLLKHLDRREN